MSALPDFDPVGATFAQARGWRATPMSPDKILKQSRRLFLGAGFPVQRVIEIKGLYAARRVLPTLALRSRLSAPELLLNGDWSVTKEAKRTAMPFLYSDSKLWQQAALRAELPLTASSQNPILSCSHDETVSPYTVSQSLTMSGTRQMGRSPPLGLGIKTT